MTQGRRRRALSDQAGEVRSSGDPRLCALLERALGAAATERGAGGPHDPEGLTHGFHAYPARMHRGVAAVLVDGLTRPGDVVLDPFCGSGTVLVEAMVAGRKAVGIDLSTLALRIAEVKVDVRGARSREAFLERARAVAERSAERVRARVDARAPLPPSEARWYQGHVLKELAGLFEELGAVDLERDLRAMELIFSANLVKLSRQRADTAEQEVDKRLKKGLPTELFLRKAEELAGRWAALAEATPRGAKEPRLIRGDARRAPQLLGRTRPHLVLTSPPYGGTYDYASHHARRHAWLGIDPRPLARLEIGARRHMRGADAAARWDQELAASLHALRSAVRRGGLVALLLGDAELGGRRVRADEQLDRLAPEAGLVLRATASAPRQDRRGGAPRREHLLLLSPA